MTAASSSTTYKPLPISTGLSPEQVNATKNLGEAAIIYGVPGSGKTTVLVYRTLMLLEAGVDPGRVLFLTTTEDCVRHARAAMTDADQLIRLVVEWKDLREEQWELAVWSEINALQLSEAATKAPIRRIAATNASMETRQADELKVRLPAIAELASYITVATPLQYACTLLRRFCRPADTSAWSFWTDDQALDVISALVRPFLNAQDNPRAEANRFFRWRADFGSMYPEDPPPTIFKDWWRPLFEQYCHEKQRQRALDRYDVIGEALELLNRGGLGEAWEDSRPTHLLADNVNDFRAREIRLALTAMGKERGITFAGNQDLRTQMDITERHWDGTLFWATDRQAQPYRLTRNYRSGVPLARTSARLALHEGMTGLTGDGLAPAAAIDGGARHLTLTIVDDPAYAQYSAAIGRAQDLAAQGSRWHSVVFLLPSRYIKPELLTSFAASGAPLRLMGDSQLPSVSRGRSGPRNRGALGDADRLLAFLTYVLNPWDDSAFIAATFGSHPSTTAQKAIANAKERTRATGRHLGQTALEYDAVGGQRSSVAATMGRLAYDRLEVLDRLAEPSVTVADVVLDAAAHLAAGGTIVATPDFSRDVISLLESARGFRGQPGQDLSYQLAGFLDLWSPVLNPGRRSAMSRGPLLSQPHGVSVCSIEGSAGLEWDHVILLDADDQAIPIVCENGRDLEYIEVQQRLLYVAMTRARVGFHMYVTAQRSQNREAAPIRIGEILGDEVAVARVPDNGRAGRE